jgi:hypothetical protein
VKSTRPGITLGAPGPTIIRPTVATTSDAGARDPLGGQHHLGGGNERIASQRHRRGAGMARHAGDGELIAQLRGDAGDHADRQPLGFEHRALLDMGFDVSEDRGGRAASR